MDGAGAERNEGPRGNMVCLSKNESTSLKTRFLSTVFYLREPAFSVEFRHVRNDAGSRGLLVVRVVPKSP